ncbi:MAG: M15 family metallopeptidase [bacterium]|nr:M15 family metallopeptidase [bacterium]
MEKFDKKIEHQYTTTDACIGWLKKNGTLINVKDSDYICFTKEYYKQNISGGEYHLFLRDSVYQKLFELSELLGTQTKIAIFDGFRSTLCQKSLFDKIYFEIRNTNLHLSQEELNKEVRKFVAHPDEPSRFAIPPHNSGGAIDLTLMDMETNTPWDFGTEFDYSGEESETNFFEQDYNNKYQISEQRWMLIRKNRRIFFNMMKSIGFVNFSFEWWHYDLGDCLWANEVGSSWFYPSMEGEVLNWKGMNG